MDPRQKWLKDTFERAREAIDRLKYRKRDDGKESDRRPPWLDDPDYRASFTPLSAFLDLNATLFNRTTTAGSWNDSQTDIHGFSIFRIYSMNKKMYRRKK
jgi:hypothetical protein